MSEDEFDLIKMVLYRFGKDAETVGKLSADALRAKQAIGLHGVSVVDESRLRSGKPLPPSAPIEEIVKHFPVTKTLGPGHYTVELPEPVTQATADVFNRTFGR